MKDLSTSIITAKGRISTTGAWLNLITLSFNDTVIGRYVNNVEDVVFESNTYVATPFIVSQVKESLRGDLPRVTLTLYDAELNLKTNLQDNDGMSGAEIVLNRVLFDKNANPTDTDITQFFTVLDVSYVDSEAAVVFNMGLTTPLNRRFPRDRFISTICRHKFKDGFCRYGLDDEGVISTNLLTFVRVISGRDYIRLAPYAAFTRFSDGQIIRVSGSLSNDNDYLIDEVTYNDGSDGYTRFYINSNYQLTEESSSPMQTATITAFCDYTVTICRANNNSHRYGGSPGVSGGYLYGS